MPIERVNPVAAEYRLPDYSQTKLLAQLQQYLQYLGDERRLLNNATNGLCSGLAALWLYNRVSDQEGNWQYRIEHILNWQQPEQVATDPIFEQMINAVIILQQDKLFRGVGQDEIASTFALLLGDNQLQLVRDPQKFLFAFNRAELSKLLRRLGAEHKMLRFDNSFHTVGLMYDTSGYYVYDPDSLTGPQHIELAEIDELVDCLFQALNHSLDGDYLAVYLSIFDFEEYPMLSNGINVMQYYTELMQGPEYRAAVLSHSSIFYLAARYYVRDVIDFLFDNGYQYKPCIKSKVTELAEAAYYEDKDKLDYLVNKGLDIDQFAVDGTNPLGFVAFYANIEMLNYLLIKGANPNAIADNAVTMFNCAMYGNSSNEEKCRLLTMLLAYGMQLPPKDFKTLTNHFQKLTVVAIVAHAIYLNLYVINADRNCDDALYKVLSNGVEHLTKQDLKIQNLEFNGNITALLSILREIKDKLEVGDKNSNLVTNMIAKLDGYFLNHNYKPEILGFSNKLSAGGNSTVSKLSPFLGTELKPNF